jgi:hypothetical protein
VIGGHSVSEEDANEPMDRVNRLAGAPERNRGFKTQVRYIAYGLSMTLYFGDAPRERRRGTRRGAMATGCGFRWPSSHYADLAKLGMRSVIADNKARTYQGGVTRLSKSDPARE